MWVAIDCRSKNWVAVPRSLGSTVLGYSKLQNSRGEGGDMEYRFVFTKSLESYFFKSENKCTNSVNVINLPIISIVYNLNN
jgi:hypothetical protein